MTSHATSEAAERSLLAAVVESSDDAIVTKDVHGIITSWNRGAEIMFGYSAEEAIGKFVSILIPEYLQGEEPEILRKIRNGEKIDHYETVRRTKDGKLIDISLTVSPVRDASGTIVGASKIARDITLRNRSESVRRSAEGLSC
jgi:PAS domain S-box-containing protein